MSDDTQVQISLTDYAELAIRSNEEFQRAQLRLVALCEQLRLVELRAQLDLTTHLAQALAGACAAIIRTSEQYNGITGFAGARLSDGRAALAAYAAAVEAGTVPGVESATIAHWMPDDAEDR